MTRDWRAHLLVLALSPLAALIGHPVSASAHADGRPRAADQSLSARQDWLQVDAPGSSVPDALSSQSLAQNNGQTDLPPQDPGDAAIAALEARLERASRIRLHLNKGRVEVGQASATETGLSFSELLKGDSENMLSPVAWKDLREVEVATGAQARSTLRGALIMGGIGALLGGGYALAFGGSGSDAAKVAIPVGAALGGVGALFGFGLGLASDKWETIYVNR